MNAGAFAPVVLLAGVSAGTNALECLFQYPTTTS